VYRVNLVLSFLLAFLVSNQIAISNEILVEESNNHYVILKLEAPDFQFGQIQSNGQSFQTISFPDCAFTCTENKPKLPIKTALIGIPASAEIQLQIVNSEYSARKVYQIEPVKHISVGLNTEHKSTKAIKESYKSINRFYPEEIVQIGFTGYIRNARVAQIQFNPAQYNPAIGIIRLYHNLEVKVIFKRFMESPAKKTLTNSPIESEFFKQILEKNILNYDISKKWQSKQNSIMPSPALINQQPGANLSPNHCCRVYVDKEGIYSINYEDLKYALGKEIDQIDPRTFKMYNKGKPVPIYVRGETDRKFNKKDEIIFYGVHNKGEQTYYDKYSFENVYWLYWTGTIGTRMIEHKVENEFDTDNVLNFRKYKYLTHFEENNIFIRLPQAKDNITGDYHYERYGYILHRGDSMFLPPLPFDNWYWDEISAPNLKTYSFDLPDVAETSLSATVRIALRGRTANPANPDHHIQIWLNGKKLLEDAKWDGQQLHTFESDEISQAYLVKNQNQIEIICPGDTQAKEIDQVLLDWIEVEYWRDYTAVDNFLQFSFPIDSDNLSGFQNEARAIISNFSTNRIEVYGTDGSKYTGIAVVEDKNNPGKYQAIVRVPGQSLNPNVRYFALDTDRFQKPKAVIRDEPSYLKSTANGADYIIITHDDFTSGVRELAELRVAQGLRVAIVTTQNIYDEFNYGILSPYAIRDFLAYAYENWRLPSPSFVTLIGDVKTIKPKPSKELFSIKAFIPTVLVRSNQYGATASDFQFSLLHGEDALPDIAVSRLPVNNMIELNDVIEKVISYEKNKVLGIWRKRLLFLGGTGGKDEDFSSQSEDLIKSYIPNLFEISRIYSQDHESPYYGETMDVISGMSSGNLFVNFIGHGGGGIWSDNRMMGLEDVELLENKGRYPFILSMTCFTGDFENENRQCLGEKMVIAEKRGAIGFLGATGLGWVYGDFWLAHEMFKSLFELSSTNKTTIGNIVTNAKINFLSKYPNYIDIANIFTLFGDSAQLFEFPEKSIKLQTPGAIESDRTLEIKGSITDQELLNNGELEVAISFPSNEEGISQIQRVNIPINSEQFSLQTEIPQYKSGVGIIRAYAWNESTDAIGATTYSLEMPYISDFYIEPLISLNSKSYLYAEAYGIGSLSFYAYWTHNPEKGWTKVSMNPFRENIYRTATTLPSDSSSVVYYYLELIDSKGRTVKTPRQYYGVAAYPDLTFTDKKIRWIIDKDSFLLAEVKNIGKQPANNIVVRFYEDSTENKKIGKDQLITELEPDDYTVVQVQWEPKKDEYTIFVEIDPDEKIVEQNEFNNIISETFYGDKFVLTPQKGSNGAIQSLDGNLTFNLAGGKIKQNAVLDMKKLDRIPLRQPELKYAPLPENSDGAVYSLKLVSENVETEEYYNFPANLSIQPEISQTSNLDRLKIYSYDPVSSKWVLAGKNFVQNNKVKAEIMMTESLQTENFFALLESNDQTAPEIEITIEHQGFIPGSYVSESPVFTVALRDDNGIDIRKNSSCEVPERLMLFKDQTKVDRTEYSVSISPSSSGLVLLAYSTNFSPGQHMLTVQAFDSSGNLGEDNIEFTVAGELEIKKIANYPNPVKPGNNRSRGEGTIFAYILTKQADIATLKIYTGSGRLVKSFDTLDVFADYNEFFWDGLDEDGEELSNGVYFYKMKVEQDDKVDEKTGKLVILR